MPDEDKIKTFLEIDEDVNKDKEIIELIYRSKSIYILHYPESKNMQVSFGLINNIEKNIINHYCTTYMGSSGSPILSLESFKVIGIHNAYGSKGFNKGIFIKNAINEFNNEYKNFNQKINNYDIIKKYNENIKKRILEINSDYSKSGDERLYELVSENEIKELFKKEDGMCMILSRDHVGAGFFFKIRFQRYTI